jgi:hypothetical protein
MIAHFRTHLPPRLNVFVAMMLMNSAQQNH